MSKPSFRVYLISHADRRLSGILMRSWAAPPHAEPLAAYGDDEEDVYRQLEVLLEERLAAGTDHPSSYLWEEELETRRVTVEIFPSSPAKHRSVIGKRRIPLRVTYSFCPLEGGGFRVMLPRFGWGFILEDLEIAPEVLKGAIGGALLGEQPQLLYHFRSEGDEVVRAWAPQLLRRVRIPGDGEGAPGGAERGSDAPRAETHPTLAAVADEWVERSAAGKLPFVVGLDAPLELPPGFLERRPLRSILLVGGTGVGKTAWVRRLARHLVTVRRQRNSHGPRIFATSRDRIIAGMIYLGMWQERCLALIAELGGRGDYLYLDGLTALLGEQPDGSSIGEILAGPAIAGEIALIAECTEPELERARRRHPALMSSFHVIHLAERTRQEMPGLLLQYQAKKGTKVIVHPEGLERLVEHLDTFETATRFPGKGFRFLDWLAQDAGPDKALTLYPSDVSAAYSRFSGLPVELISDDHPVSAAQIAAELGGRVIGQPEACRAAAGILARFKSGLLDPEKPVGSLFFVGPTGVGKTELAKQLARYLFGAEDRMIRLDMSEYAAPGSAQRMIEAGEGARSLAERVRQQPLALVLLDELEKAHPEVFDLLLGVLGEGRLTDSLGRLVDLRMTLIVMTSNLGGAATPAIGFEGPPGTDHVRHVRRHFRPELYHRIDEVVPFRALSPDDIEAIVELIAAGLATRTGLSRRNLRLAFDPAAKRRLAELGYHPTWGARPLARIIEERVITPIAVRMARDPALRDRTIRVLAAGSAAAAELTPAELAEHVSIGASGESTDSQRAGG